MTAHSTELFFCSAGRIQSSADLERRPGAPRIQIGATCPVASGSASAQRLGSTPRCLQIAEYGMQLSMLETMENELLAMRRIVSQQTGRMSALNRDYAGVRKQMLTLEYEYAHYRTIHPPPNAEKGPTLPLPQAYECSGQRRPVHACACGRCGCCYHCRLLSDSSCLCVEDALWRCLDPRAAEFSLVAESLRAGLPAGANLGAIGLGAPADGISRFSLTRVLKTCYRSDHPAVTRFCQHNVRACLGSDPQARGSPRCWCRL